MMLSVVTTVYRSEAYLPEFLDQVLGALKEVECREFELVFVLDGITDFSREWLLEKQPEVAQIKVIELSRNFGHHAAISAGLHQAKGDLVFLIDCDLEVPPKVLVDFMSLSRSTQADVVYGVQQNRKGGFFEKRMGGLFWRLFNLLSNIKVPPNTVTERLMTRSYVNALLAMGDKNLFLAGMMHWVGFTQVPCTVHKGQREGKSTYTFCKRMDLLLEAVLSFSDKPIRWMFFTGIVFLLVSLGALVGLVPKMILDEGATTGWFTLYAFLFFCLGSVLSGLGLIGMYAAKIANQVKNRPLYWIKKVYP